MELQMNQVLSFLCICYSMLSMAGFTIESQQEIFITKDIKVQAGYIDIESGLRNLLRRNIYSDSLKISSASNIKVKPGVRIEVDGTLILQANGYIILNNTALEATRHIYVNGLDSLVLETPPNKKDFVAHTISIVGTQFIVNSGFEVLLKGLHIFSHPKPKIFYYMPLKIISGKITSI